MGFVMQGLDAEDYDRQYSDRELLRRISGYFRPAAGAMALVGVMITLNSIMQMVQPLAISEGIDRIRDDGAGSVLWWLTAVILLAGVMAWGFNYVRQTVTARVVGDVVLALRTDAFDATMEDGTTRPLVLDGRFMLEADDDGTWSVFGYDVTFDDGDETSAEAESGGGA